MLGNIIIALSASVATLALLDFFLSDRQKKALSDSVLSVWNWLDEMKRKSFLEWLKRPRAQIVFFVSAATVFSVIVSNLVNPSTWSGAVMLGCLIFSIPASLWAGRRIFSLIAHADSRPALNRMVNCVIGAFGGIVVVSLGALMVMQIEGLSYQWQLIAFPVLVVSNTTVMFLIILKIPVTAANMLGSALSVVEFIVRRIAEYPKGPILALSTLFGGVAACFKIFG